MGKNGDLLRAMKDQKVIYHWTRQDVREHDRQIIDIALKAHEKEHIKLARDMVTQEWELREKEFASGDRIENFLSIIKYLNAVTCKILIERFGWKPPRKGVRLTKTAMFTEYLVDEIDKICNDDDLDIRKYCDDVFKKYGIRFAVEQTEELEESLS